MRDRREVERLMYTQAGHLDSVHNIDSSSTDTTEYTMDEAIVLAMVLDKMVYELSYNRTTKEIQLGQQYILEKGLKWFGYKGIISLKQEMGHLDDRDCLVSRHVKELNNREQKRAQWALAYLTKKHDGTIKG